MEIAIATNTAPSQWFNESAATVITAVDILNRNAEEIDRKGRKHG